MASELEKQLETLRAEHPNIFEVIESLMRCRRHLAEEKAKPVPALVLVNSFAMLVQGNRKLLEAYSACRRQVGDLATAALLDAIVNAFDTDVARAAR